MAIRGQFRALGQSFWVWSECWGLLKKVKKHTLY